MKKAIRRVFAALLMLCITLTLSLSANANSAVARYDGADGISPIVVDENTPLLVEKELLTFDVTEFPKSYYYGFGEPVSYGPSVTAEYTICNPTDEEVTARLLFPFGGTPYYLEAGQIYELLSSDDRFGITLNGQKTEVELRHSFSEHIGYYEDFVTENELSTLHDGYIRDEFYFPTQTVTKYTYEASDIVLELDYQAEAVFTLDDKSGERVYCFPESDSYFLNDDGSAEVGQWVDADGQLIVLYVVGKPLDTPIKWRFYVGGGERRVGGKAELINTETMTFEEFALRDRDEDSIVSRTDWYNAIVHQTRYILHEDEADNVPLASFGEQFWDFEIDLMQWYDYKITVPAGGKAVNTVCAPIFPDIDEDFSPPVYEFNYLLSPAATWAEFKDLEIVIKTPHYLLSSTPEGFTPSEKGYTLTLDGLPNKELSFTLSASPDPEPFTLFGSIGDIFTPEVILISLGVLAGIALVGSGVIIAVVARRKGR